MHILNFGDRKRNTIGVSQTCDFLRHHIRYFSVIFWSVAYHEVVYIKDVYINYISNKHSTPRQSVFRQKRVTERILPWDTPTGWRRKFGNFIKYGPISKLFFTARIRKKFCNNTKDPITSEVCRYTTLWNVIVLTAIIENKTSVATNFKKLTTGNDMFIVSVIV